MHRVPPMSGGITITYGTPCTVHCTHAKCMSHILTLSPPHTHTFTPPPPHTPTPSHTHTHTHTLTHTHTHILTHTTTHTHTHTHTFTHPHPHTHTHPYTPGGILESLMPLFMPENGHSDELLRYHDGLLNQG